MDPNGQAYLFGSRLDDNARGGDIDLYIELSRDIPLKESLRYEYRLNAQLDTKVDLLVKAPQDPDQPIHQIARQGQRL